VNLRSLGRAACALAVLASLDACREIASTAPTRALRISEAPSFNRSSKPVSIVEGRVVVRYRSGADRDAVVMKHGAKHHHDLLLDRAEVLEVAPGSEEAAAQELSSDPDVLSAEPDVLYEIVPCEVGNCTIPTETFRGFRWDLNNDGTIRDQTGRVVATTGKRDADIDWAEMADALGSNFTGSAIVGIIDTGILDTHIDLAGKVVAARNFATGYPSTLVADRIGHGTHVSGIVAANGSNNAGVAGVGYSPNIKLINAKACELYLDATGAVISACPTSSVADAIVYAVDNGANVLNLSLGGAPNATAGSPLQQAALQYARAHNVLPFCASGNENFNGIAFPARFPECVAVGATNWSDQRASYSNFGPELAISAPGGDLNPLNTAFSLILSTYISTTTPNNTTYAFLAGTSMATPQAAGLAAVLYASGLTSADAVLQRIEQTADDLGPPGRDDSFGFGRINAYRALTLKDPSAPPVASTDPSVSGLEGSPISFKGDASFDPNNHPVTFRWDFGDGGTSTLANPTHTYADNGVYNAVLTVTDEAGNRTTAVSQVNVANVPPAVSASLDVSTVHSGESGNLGGSFTDPGVLDAPWSWAIAWGESATTGSTSDMSSTIGATHRFCAAGNFVVRLTVTDKDGGSGAADNPVVVLRNPIAIDMPDAVLNPKSNGKLAVVVLSTPTFDAGTIDPTTVTLGDGVGSEARVVVKNNGTLHMSIEDENGDGRPDLVLHFDRGELAANGDVRSGVNHLLLRATLNDGCTQMEGVQIVRVVP
jgi:thermitase